MEAKGSLDPVFCAALDLDPRSHVESPIVKTLIRYSPGSCVLTTEDAINIRPISTLLCILHVAILNVLLYIGNAIVPAEKESKSKRIRYSQLGEIFKKLPFIYNKFFMFSTIYFNCEMYGSQDLDETVKILY